MRSRAGSPSRRSPARRRMGRLALARGTVPSRHRPRSSGSSHSRPGRIGRRRQLAQQLRRARSVRERWNAASPRFEKNGRGTFSGRRSGGAPSDRDHLGARCKRVQPLGRRRHPGADDRDPRDAYSCGSYACTRVRDTRSDERDRGGRSRRARARTGRRRRARSPRRPRGSRSTRRSREAAIPADPRPRPPRRARGTRRPSGGSGSRRDATSGRSDPVRRDSRTARPGKRRGAARWPSRLRAHPLLPDRRRALAPHRRRILVRARRRRSRSGSSPPCRKRGVRGERRQPAADDGAPRRRVHATSPSRPAGPGRSSAGTRRTPPAE